MPWKRRPPEPLEKEIDALKTTIVCLRRELTDKEGYAAKLELVVRQRSRTIDTLRGKLEQSREQIRRLDQECEHYADMIRIMPQLDAALLSPK